MGVQRLGQVIYVATDMEPSVVFYRDVLGLRLKFQDGDQWAAFDAGQATFALSAPQEAAGCSGSMRAGGVAAFRVDDIRALWLALEGRGLTKSSLLEGSHELRFQVVDPGGNPLVFYQPRINPPSR